ncbi:MAG: CHASE2 domain-containing protein [bacterium]
MASYTFKKIMLPLITKVGIGLGIGVAVVVVTTLLDVGFINNVDYLTMDYRYNARHKRLSESGELKNVRDNGDVVIVGIKQKDVEMMPKSFPFPRSYYAKVIENLSEAGAKVIAFDIMFDAVRDTADDARFVVELRKHDNVIIAVKTEEQDRTTRYIEESTVRKYNLDSAFYNACNRVGFVDVAGKDKDEVTRRYVPEMLVGRFTTPTFGFAVLNKLFGMQPYDVASVQGEFFSYHNQLIPRYDNASFLLNYYGPNETFKYIPFNEVIDDSTFKTKEEITLETDLNLFDIDSSTINKIKGKIVLIGSVMPEERDIHAVPLVNEDGSNTMNGVEIHATAIQNVLDGAYFVKAAPAVEIVLILLLSTISFLGILKIKQMKFKYVAVLELGAVLIVALLIFGIFEFSLLSFTNGNTIINIVNPSLAIILAYLSTAVYQYLTERQQKALIKNVFSHYISSAVVNELVANPEKARLGGDKRELTVFFSDIAGFTTISERYLDKPEALVDLLNEYLDEMTSIIMKHQGTLDKYEGDAIMAFWGAPIPQKDHALRTCLAALDMQKRLAALRPKWMKDKKPSIEARFGINSGTMIVGNMGGKDRFDYTVIGDSVNLASRLEGANKQYGTKIMISDMTYQHVKDKVMVRELDLIQVKGKNEPVKVFELMGTSDMVLTDNQKQALEIYQEGLKLYRQRQFEEAIAYMQQARQLDETCTVAEVYEQRAGLYQIHPPPDEWNGVFVMTTK